MKIKFLSKWLVAFERFFALRIVIVDDTAAYFNEQMVNAASLRGLGRIERLFQVDSAVLESFLAKPPDIIILDVKGTTLPDVAKDGLALAAYLSKSISSYIVVTSAHKYHLTNRVVGVDYILEQRLLTVVDFLKQLEKIRLDCLTRKKRFYQNIGLRLAISMGKLAVSPSS